MEGGMYQLQPAPDCGGRHLSSEQRYIEDRGGTYKLEGGTCHPEDRTYHRRGGISKIRVVPIRWRAAPVSQRTAPIICGAVYRR